MSGISIDIDTNSAERLLRKLNHIDKELTPAPRTELAKFLMEAGENLATYVKQQPEGIMPVITGRLRASVHSKHKPTENFLYTDKHGEAFSGGLKANIKEGEEVVVGTNVEYAFKVDLRKGFMRKAKTEFMPIFDRELKKLAQKTVSGK